MLSCIEFNNFYMPQERHYDKTPDDFIEQASKLNEFLDLVNLCRDCNRTDKTVEYLAYKVYESVSGDTEGFVWNDDKIKNLKLDSAELVLEIRNLINDPNIEILAKEAIANLMYEYHYERFETRRKKLERLI